MRRQNRPYLNGHMRPNRNTPFNNPMIPFRGQPFQSQPWFNAPQFMHNQRFQGQLPLPFGNVNNFPRPGPMRPPMFSSNQSQRGKRPSSSVSDDPESKRTKVDESDSSSSKKYIVPCSKGTEQITVSIWEYFLKSQMTDSDLEKKLMLQKTLHSIIKEAFPESRLFIVGSSMTGFATKTSDVDMCLVISEKYINQKKEAPLILTTLQKALRSCSFVKFPQVIRAKVPILKFKDSISGFECDLNINNTIGIRNTHLLRYYAHIDWRVRPLMLFIKHWARFHDINDASKKTISSYSLSLMLIHFLQAGVKPAVLPCLQAMKPKLFSGGRHVFELSLEKEDIGFESSNKATLGELFLGFLNYYSNEFIYNTDVVSIRKGRRITQEDVDHYESDWKFLCIEEPFEGTNTARSVYDHFVFMRILRVFNSSYTMLQRHRNTDSILTCPF